MHSQPGRMLGNRRQFLRYSGLGALSVAGAALIGCSAAPKAASTGAPQGASTPAGASTPTVAQPKPGGIFRSANQTEPTNLDVFLDPSVTVSGFAAVSVYSRLVRWQTGPGVSPGSVLEGDAAQDWQSPDSGKTWTFRLRPNVKFHPKPPLNGRAATAEDVKTSVERHLKVSPAKKTLQDLIDRVETPDANTVTFRLKEQYPPFPEVLSGPLALFIYSKEANAGQIETQKVEGAIGTGPWMWKTKTTAVAWEFERHPEWHIKDRAGRSLPYAAGWRVSIIPEYAQMLAQFASGQLSTFNPSTADAEGLLQRVPKAKIVAEKPPPNFNMFAFHQPTPTNVMRDTRLRRAWSMAIDRPALFEVFGQFEKAKKLGHTLTGALGNPPIPDGPGMEYWLLDPYGPKMGPNGQWFTYNVAEAKKLVQAAGYDGQRIEIVTPSPTFLPTLEAHIPMLKEVGFNPQIRVMEFSQYVAGPYVGKGPYQAAYGNMTPFPTVDEFCFNYMMPGGVRNMPGLTDEVPGASKVFELVRKQRTETNREARRETIYEIQRLSADQMWWIPSINQRWATLAFGQPQVQNFGEYQGALQAPAEQSYPFYWLDA